MTTVRRNSDGSVVVDPEAFVAWMLDQRRQLIERGDTPMDGSTVIFRAIEELHRIEQFDLAMGLTLMVAVAVAGQPGEYAALLGAFARCHAAQVVVHEFAKATGQPQPATT
jgi:hypothetical protein